MMTQPLPIAGARQFAESVNSSPIPVPILTYHSLDNSASAISVAPSAFGDQMDCLADIGARGISLADAAAHLAANGAWPERCAVLTFDDGYANTYEVALPILARHGFSATVFVVTGFVNRTIDWRWPGRWQRQPAPLTWNQVREFCAAGLEIGCHTVTHPDLRWLSPAAAEDEIVGARNEIEDRIALPVETFAYPFGLVGAAASSIARREFRAACTTELQRARRQPLWALPRVDMYYIRSTELLTRLIHGRLDRYLAARRWARRLRRTVLPRAFAAGGRPTRAQMS
ncbi:MAG: polysaccharide deacetylase family protein [Deltaproteobacteria bacterium]|nr:polysaccharide deacetylase family protein [Deltaproteobacteria bacterium]